MISLKNLLVAKGDGGSGRLIMICSMNYLLF